MIKHRPTDCGKSYEERRFLSHVFKDLCLAVFCNVMSDLKEAICTCMSAQQIQRY